MESISSTLFISWLQHPYMLRSSSAYISIKWSKSILSIYWAYTEHTQTWHVGCPRKTNTDSWHYTQTVSPAVARFDVNYLKTLLGSGVQDIKRECTYIDQVIGRRTLCGKWYLVATRHILNFCRVWPSTRARKGQKVEVRCTFWYIYTGRSRAVPIPYAYLPRITYSPPTIPNKAPKRNCRRCSRADSAERPAKSHSA